MWSSGTREASASVSNRQPMGSSGWPTQPSVLYTAGDAPQQLDEEGPEADVDAPKWLSPLRPTPLLALPCRPRLLPMLPMLLRLLL